MCYTDSWLSSVCLVSQFAQTIILSMFACTCRMSCTTSKCLYFSCFFLSNTEKEWKLHKLYLCQVQYVHFVTLNVFDMEHFYPNMSCVCVHILCSPTTLQVCLVAIGRSQETQRYHLIFQILTSL